MDSKTATIIFGQQDDQVFRQAYAWLHGLHTRQSIQWDHIPMRGDYASNKDHAASVNSAH